MASSRRATLPPAWLAAAALLLAGAGALLVSTAGHGEPDLRRVGGNAPVNAGAGNQLDISAQNSPTLVRNPRRAGELAIANRVDSPRYSCALRTSSDGGSTWSRVPIPHPAGEEHKCYAPDVTYGPDGTLYLSFVTLKGLGNVPSAAWIASAKDGDRRLSLPRRVLGKLAFGVRLVADPARAGRLYLTWLDASEVGLYRFTEPGNAIRAIRSDDGGVSWSDPVAVNDAARQRVVAPSSALGARGELYVLYLDLGGDRLDYEGLHEGRGGPPYPGRFSLVLARSGDGGQSFEESVVDTRIQPTERFLAFIPPTPSLAVDRASGRVYAGFEDGRRGDPDVMVWSLGARDRAWRGPVRVNDTPPRDATAQYRPRLSVAPDGRLDVVYYDRRKDRANRGNAVSLQSSFDGGRSFSRHVALSTRSFDSRIGFGAERGMPEIGNRIASLSTNDRNLAVWTDTRSGTPVTGKQDLMRAVAVIAAPRRPAGWQRSGLRYGALALMLAGLSLLAREGSRRLGARRGAHLAA